MDNTTRHRIKPKACPQCELSPHRLGTGADYNWAKIYSRNEPYEGLGVTIKQNICEELERVSAPNIPIPELLHATYIAVVKHMMDWIQGVLKEHLRQQGFDNARKVLPLELGFFARKKATVRFGTGKERRCRI